MSAFQEKDSEYFFGRETFVEGTKDKDGLIQVVHKQSLVTVVGSSGSGKSSVIFAGLIPRLRAEGSWLIESFRPLNQPFFLLTSALVRSLKPKLDEIQQAREAAKLLADMNQGLTLPQIVASILENHPNKRLLLVVDQFEELYTLCQDTQEQQRFVDALLTMIQSAPRRLTLMLTLRTDFLNYALNYPPFGETLRQYRLLPLSAMSREDMQTVIERPAQKMQVQIEEGLTELILNDVKQEPGNLPLLEFALTQLWVKQNRGKLTHRAYAEIGGVAKALANHAEAVYGKLSEIEQKQAQRIFLQLVRPGEGTEDTRRLATPSEVGNWELVTFLAGAEARLVVTGRDEQTGEEKVEVVHEALIREWERLRGWMEADRNFRTWQERLRTAVRQWKDSGKDEGALWRGVLLRESEDWQQKRSDELTQEQREFIQASVALREKETEEQERSRILTEAHQKANRLIRTGSGILALSIIGAIIAGVYASYASKQAWEAIKQADEAKESLKLEQQGVQAQRQFEEGNQLGALLTATRIGREMQAKVRDGRPLEKYPAFSPLLALQTILSNIQERIQLPHEDSGYGSVSVSFSPDGKQIATGSNGTVRLWNRLGKKLSEVKLNNGKSQLNNGEYFNPSDTIVCFSSSDVKIATTNSIRDDVLLWNSYGQQISSFKASYSYQNDIKFSPDCKLIATSKKYDLGSNNVVNLWNLSGKNIAKLPGIAASFSPDSKRIATIDGNLEAAKISLWNSVGQKLGDELDVYNSYPAAVSFDGNKIATLSSDNKVLFWNLSGEHIGSFQASQSINTQNLKLSSDGKLLATRQQDNTLHLWRLLEKEPIAEFKGEFQLSNYLEFSPDYKQVAITGFIDRTVKLYDLPKQYTEFDTSQYVSNMQYKAQIKFSPNGKQIATSDYNSVRLWNLSGQQIPGVFNKDSYINGDNQIVTRGSDGSMQFFDLSGQKLTELKSDKIFSAPNFLFSTAVVSPNGKYITAVENNEKIKLWNLQGEKTTTFTFKSYCCTYSDMSPIHFSPDSKQMTISGGGVSLRNLSGHEIGYFNVPSTSVHFSPDNKQIAILDNDGSLSLWKRRVILKRKPQRIALLKENRESVNDIAFSPDWKFIATVGKDKIVRLWNQSGKLQHRLKGHENTILQIHFSADGQRIITLDAHKIRVWSLSGEQIAQFEEPKSSFLDVAVSPDSKQLAVLIVPSNVEGGSSKVRILPVDNLDSLLERSCNWLRDYLLNNPNATDEDRKMCGILRR
ncbi:hypothetical protein A6770_05315 [Nostoc minutum NIES-26]|uniref:Novel STAND NTPase 1 domain-containing protein n=1 Tax=Nostoc minutum NIES-26 TaxID=1844469 RepID=A0A367Q8C0_9NOSO|nr:hypothetical protein A6770_05315 [Nostoc minutum NIES-26]